MITNIITNEVQKFLNENTVVGGGDDFTFKQTFEETNILFYNYNIFSSNYDIDIVNSYVTVTWNIGFLVNTSGVENFKINIDSVDGQYTIQLRDKISDEIVQNAQKNINDIKWKFIVQNNVSLTTNNPLFAKNISFDFKNNVCELGF